MSKRQLRYGMIGGGRDAFIGAVHRMAMNLDGQMVLVAGCFSSSAEKSKLSGEDLFLDPSRVYSNYKEMADKEAARPESEKLDFVSIVTPNHMHAPISQYFLEKGFHVVCDKPMTRSLDEALALREVVKKSGRIFALTHNYTGYPMVKEAREMVSKGVLGRVLKVVAEYPQGWLADQLESGGQKQASWRTDPALSGASCCIGDIGTHAENLGRYITGLKIDALCADFTSFVAGRALEDDGNLLVRYEGGAKGVLYASQISVGEENNLTVRVYGTEGLLSWKQEHPNELTWVQKNQPARTLRRGNGYLTDAGKKFTRIPAGHPEAFIEAFANIYLEVARAIRDRLDGKDLGPYDFPNVEDGLEGMAFIETAVKSAGSDEKWVKMLA